MSEEIVEQAEEIVDVTEQADVYMGQYPEIAEKYKNGEELSDDDLDVVADVALDVLRSILRFLSVAMARRLILSRFLCRCLPAGGLGLGIPLSWI